MFKKIEKCEGEQKAIIYFDKTLKRPYLLIIGNVTAKMSIMLSTPNEVLDNIRTYELRRKFSISEISNVKKFSKIEEKSNAEVFEKYGIIAHGGSRNNAGRKVGSLKKTPKTDRTERFTMAITKDEKEFLIKSLEEYRSKKDIT